MGAYLSEPMTKKESDDGDGNDLRFGSSSMQGWRASQEDAHTCMAKFDEKSSLYGVYDGHGGAEVAIYIAKHFPELLKTTESYIKGDMENALIQAYLKIDAKIKEPETIAEIQKIAKSHNCEDGDEAAPDYEDENVSELYEEATMPLDKLVAKYQKTPPSGGLDESKESDDGEKPCSSSSSSKAVAGGSSGAGGSAGSSSSPQKLEPAAASNNKADAEENKCTPSPAEVGSSGSSITPSKSTTEENINSNDAHASSTIKEEPSNGTSGSNSKSVAENGDEKDEKEADSKVNGVSEESKHIVITDADSSEAATPTKPRKGKVHPVFVAQVDSKQPKRASAQRAIKAFADSDSSDFDSSDSDADANEKGSSDSNTSDSDDDDEMESDDDTDSDDDADDHFLNNMQEPGYDSGCTAVVSLLKWQDDGKKLNLWVANAGDSRCVVSRGGTALEMSFDHKPESAEETLRIIRAGGKVTDDGRVNGGLNLSRALGDHSYKQNTKLPAEDQMISPLPSIQTVELDPQIDDFIVLACDGVWNSMTSQQVIDFVSQRIKTAPSLSSICEEMFDACLSEDTYGDGTGCDNMTAIIIQIPPKQNGNGVKRPLTEENEEITKRPKLEAEEGQ